MSGLLGPPACRHQEEQDVRVSAEGRDVHGAPPVPIGQPNVRAELDQELDQLQVAQLTALVQSRLALRVEDVEVDLALSGLQEPPQSRGVAILHSFP